MTALQEHPLRALLQGGILVNLMHHLAVATALCVGGWFAVEGRIEVVVATVGGLGRISGLLGDLLNRAREYSVVGVKYRLFADAANRLANVAPERSTAAPAG